MIDQVQVGSLTFRRMSLDEAGEVIATTQPSFHTFCHISEYDAEGYQPLRQMVATSAPITLWSPASIFFRAPNSSLNANEFIDLVMSGAIRILGRKQWLTDKEWRDSNRPKWEGYSWDDYIDSRIKEIYEYDEQQYAIAQRDKREPYHRRVLAAGDAPGPALVDQVAQKLTSDDRRDLYTAYMSPTLRLPRGVRQAAARGNETPDAIVRSVLIDALNHADAYRESTARAPFFLDSPDSLFLKRLAVILEEDRSPVSATHVGDTDAHQLRAEAEERQEVARKMAAQILQLLKYLEERRPNSQTPDLSRFLNSPGHEALVSWYSELYDNYQLDGAVRDDALLTTLTRAVNNEDGRLDMFKELRSDWIGALGIVEAVTSFIVNHDLAGLPGFGIATIEVGKVGLQMLRWIPPRFRTQHWAYLYAFGRGPIRQDQQKMKQILEDLAAGR